MWAIGGIPLLEAYLSTLDDFSELKLRVKLETAELVYDFLEANDIQHVDC